MLAGAREARDQEGRRIRRRKADREKAGRIVLEEREREVVAGVVAVQVARKDPGHVRTVQAVAVDQLPVGLEAVPLRVRDDRPVEQQFDPDDASHAGPRTRREGPAGGKIQVGRRRQGRRGRRPAAAGRAEQRRLVEREVEPAERPQVALVVDDLHLARLDVRVCPGVVGRAHVEDVDPVGQARRVDVGEESRIQGVRHVRVSRPNLGPGAPVIRCRSRQSAADRGRDDLTVDQEVDVVDVDVIESPAHDLGRARDSRESLRPRYVDEPEGRLRDRVVQDDGDRADDV